jgi:hypothetical protein
MTDTAQGETIHAAVLRLFLDSAQFAVLLAFQATLNARAAEHHPPRVTAHRDGGIIIAAPALAAPAPAPSESVNRAPDRPDPARPHRAAAPTPRKKKKAPRKSKAASRLSAPPPPSAQQPAPPRALSLRPRRPSPSRR